MNTDELYDRLSTIDPLLPLAVTVMLRRCDGCTCGWSVPGDRAQGIARLRDSAERARSWKDAQLAAVRGDAKVASWFDAFEVAATEGAETEDVVQA